MIYSEASRLLGYPWMQGQNAARFLFLTSEVSLKFAHALRFPALSNFDAYQIMEEAWQSIMGLVGSYFKSQVMLTRARCLTLDYPESHSHMVIKHG